MIKDKWDGEDRVFVANDRSPGAADVEAIRFDGKLGKVTANLADASVKPAACAPLLRYYFGLGNSGAGHVTLASAKVGDIVVAAINMTGDTDVTADFEANVTVAGQIQQLSTDLSADKLFIVLQAQS